jgi:hypothetical protein
MEPTQWVGTSAQNALPMSTKTIDARALLDRRELGHEYG